MLRYLPKHDDLGQLCGITVPPPDWMKELAKEPKNPHIAGTPAALAALETKLDVKLTSRNTTEAAAIAYLDLTDPRTRVEAYIILNFWQSLVEAVRKEAKARWTGRDAVVVGEGSVVAILRREGGEAAPCFSLLTRYFSHTEP
jgi:hypothetical protein